jgi:DNA-binding NtrC family response regulator
MSTGEAGSQRIVIIERSDKWRIFACRTLEKAGFQVFYFTTFQDYHQWQVLRAQLPLILLFGVTGVGPEERALIGHLLKYKIPLLVFSTSLIWQDLRDLFRLGVSDAHEKTYDPTRLIQIIRDEIAHQASRTVTPTQTKVFL